MQDEQSDSDLSELDDPQPKRKATTTALKEKSKKAKAPAKRRKVQVEEAAPVGGEVGVKDDCPLFSMPFLLSPSALLLDQLHAK